MRKAGKPRRYLPHILKQYGIQSCLDNQLEFVIVAYRQTVTGILYQRMKTFNHEFCVFCLLHD